MTRYQDSLPKDALFVKVNRTIARPVAETFAYVVSVDVTHIFPRQGEIAWERQDNRLKRLGSICRTDPRHYGG
jgi:hypothetical protein